jgi:hypothetical protein
MRASGGADTTSCRNAGQRRRSYARPRALYGRYKPSPANPLVKEFGFEGRHPKRKDFCYEAGKHSGAWLKYKQTKHRSSSLAATHRTTDWTRSLSAITKAKLIFVSKVRNGFVPWRRREVWSKPGGLETDQCPFFNLPGKKTYTVGSNQRGN